MTDFYKLFNFNNYTDLEMMQVLQMIRFYKSHTFTNGTLLQTICFFKWYNFPNDKLLNFKHLYKWCTSKKNTLLHVI